MPSCAVAERGAPSPSTIGAVGALDPLPAVVAVHPPVATRDRADAPDAAGELALHLGDVPRRGARAARRARRGRRGRRRGRRPPARRRRAPRGARATSGRRRRSRGRSRCSRPPDVLRLASRRPRGPRSSRVSRRAPRCRCARCPSWRCGRRRSSGGRPRCCPSARAGGRRRGRSCRWRRAGSARSSDESSGVVARRMALSARSARSPKPSRMTSTSGRGGGAARVRSVGVIPART